MLQLRFDPATAVGTQSKQANEKRSKTARLQWENQRLKQIIENPEIANKKIRELTAENQQLTLENNGLKSSRIGEVTMIRNRLEIELKEALDSAKTDRRQQLQSSNALSSNVSKLRKKVADQQCEINKLTLSVEAALEAQEGAELDAQDAESRAEAANSRTDTVRQQLRLVKKQKLRQAEKQQEEIGKSKLLYTQMLERKKKDCTGVLAELGKLLADTEKDRGRSEGEQLALVQALHRVESELKDKIGPIKTKKDGRSFDHDIALLTMELLTLGVSERVVGQVEVLCCRHLAKRELQQAPSASTAGTWALDLREMVQHHFGEVYAESTKNGGVGYATDTTTIRRAERASNHFEMRRSDGSVRKMRAPVVELASHTALEQFIHNVEYIFEDTRRVMETAGLVPDKMWKRVSIGFLNRVMGDHVNESLWDLIEPAKFAALDGLLSSGELDAEAAQKARVFVRTKCSKHKLAKLSRDACNAMSALQDEGAAKHCNMEMKSGRTYESMGYKITEVAAWQLSTDISVANPHGHAQHFVDWQAYHDMTPLMSMPNVNKNRHYRHEKNARRLLRNRPKIMRFLTEIRDGRDDIQHPNKVTKLGNADSRLWMALHPDQAAHHKFEAEAQLCAMDMTDSLFFSPALCMITAPSIDVVNIGPKWRAGYNWCVDSTQKPDSDMVIGGLEHRCFPKYRKKYKTKGQQKAAFQVEFEQPDW